MRRLTGILLAIVMMMAVPSAAHAAIAGRPDTLEYVGVIEISAYYPAEDAQYPNNFKSQPLDELVGEIVACPTGSDLLGEDLLILCPDGRLIRRKVWDTGCKKGRLDLLVGSSAEMWAWGLQDCHVWIMRGEMK